jgi:hypothetical protein
MRWAALLPLAFAFTLGAQQRPISPLELSLEQRLDAPRRVTTSTLRLTDFVAFIATAFKVPLLVETTTPAPELTISGAAYTARQLLDIAVRQLPQYGWKDEGGVAHLYRKQLVHSSGNLLNFTIHRFYFPRDVAEFMYDFRPCVYWTIRGEGCHGGLAGLQLPELKQETLPYLRSFKDTSARSILLSALKANGRFYVLIAYESPHPNLASEFPFVNWFTQSLVADEPAPIWIARPKPGGRRSTAH